MIVERTDFVSVPVTDLERSTAFYRDTLGLEQTGEGAWPEFRLGENVFLYLLDPTNIGQEFRGRARQRVFFSFGRESFLAPALSSAE